MTDAANRQMRPNTAEALALYSLGVPAQAITAEYGMRPSSLRKLARYHGVTRPAPADCRLLARIARCERIRRNVEDYPSRSMFAGIEVAA